MADRDLNPAERHQILELLNDEMPLTRGEYDHQRILTGKDPLFHLVFPRESAPPSGFCIQVSISCLIGLRILLTAIRLRTSAELQCDAGQNTRNYVSLLNRLQALRVPIRPRMRQPQHDTAAFAGVYSDPKSFSLQVVNFDVEEPERNYAGQLRVQGYEFPYLTMEPSTIQCFTGSWMEDSIDYQLLAAWDRVPFRISRGHRQWDHFDNNSLEPRSTANLGLYRLMLCWPRVPHQVVEMRIAPYLRY